MLRTIATRQFSASTRDRLSALLGKVSSPDTKMELALLSQRYSEAESKAKSLSGQVPAIDFASYDKQLKKKYVVELKKAYESVKFPSAVNSQAKAFEEQFQQALKNAQSVVANSKEKVKQLEDQLEVMKANRITKDTTIDDIAKIYPKYEAEIQAEIKNHQWLRGI